MTPLGTGEQSSGGHIVDADGVPVVRVDGGPGGSSLLVESKDAQITASTSDGAGVLTGYTEVLADGSTLVWTLTYHADGSIATKTHA